MSGRVRGVTVVVGVHGRGGARLGVWYRARLGFASVLLFPMGTSWSVFVPPGVVPAGGRFGGMLERHPGAAVVPSIVVVNMWNCSRRSSRPGVVVEKCEGHPRVAQEMVCTSLLEASYCVGRYTARRRCRMVSTMTARATQLSPLSTDVSVQCKFVSVAMTTPAAESVRAVMVT